MKQSFTKPIVRRTHRLLSRMNPKYPTCLVRLLLPFLSCQVLAKNIYNKLHSFTEHNNKK